MRKIYVIPATSGKKGLPVIGFLAHVDTAHVDTLRAPGSTTHFSSIPLVARGPRPTNNCLVRLKEITQHPYKAGCHPGRKWWQFRFQNWIRQFLSYQAIL
jgi:hypothetical protein